MSGSQPRRILSLAGTALLVAAGSAPGGPPAGFDRLRVAITTAEPLAARPPLLVHFHGAPASTERSFRAARIDGVLVTVNCNGLSSAYRRPFADPRLFGYLLQHTAEELIERGSLEPGAEWSRLDVSCFSAGYGAVRELLKADEHRGRIDGLAAADSIYASIHAAGGNRRVDEPQMAPFLDFGRLAAAGKKVFVLSHSQLAVEPYASTVETTDYLLTGLKLERKPLQPAADQAFAPISVARRGRFTALAYPGADGEAHLRHLREIAGLWGRLRSPPDER